MITNIPPSAATLTSNTAPLPGKDLTDWLGQWGVDFIGNGDDAAGLNTLVGMCGALANVAGADAVLTDSCDEFLPVGLDWTTVGDHSVDSLRTRVIDPVARLQSAVFENAAVAKRMDERRQEIELQKPQAHREPPAEEKAYGCGIFNGELDAGELAIRRLLQNLVPPLYEAQTRPGFYFEGSATDSLTKSLQRSHQGCPYVSFSPTSVAHYAAILSAHQAVADGRQLDNGMAIRGHTTMVMSQPLLEELVATGDHHWGPNTLLLVDGSAPQLRTFSRRNAKLGSPALESRFCKALEEVLDERFRYAGRYMVSVKASWRNILWTLHTQLRQHPGLADAQLPLANKLAATLYFGLSRLSSARPGKLPISADVVISLTLFLLQRSAHALQAAKLRGQAAQMRTVASSLQSKLKDGPMTARELSQRCHRLPISDCRQALGILVDATVVTCDGELGAPGTVFALK